MSSEKALMEALPPQVREPLKIFDADKTGQFPRFHGNFALTVLHRANSAGQWSFDTDLNLDDASGKLVGFPYPIEHLAAEVHVRNGHLDIVNAHMKRGQATMLVGGTVAWKETPPGAPPTEPDITSDIKVAIRDLPLDNDLLAALPPDAALWIKRVGVSGKLDVDGRVFQGLPDPAGPARRLFRMMCAMILPSACMMARSGRKMARSAYRTWRPGAPDPRCPGDLQHARAARRRGVDGRRSGGLG